MGRPRKRTNDTSYPDYVIDSIARALYPDILVDWLDIPKREEILKCIPGEELAAQRNLIQECT